MKKIPAILIFFVLLACIALIYANAVLLPTEISSLVVKSLEDYTGKKVILGSVSLNLFKGLVLRDLIIYDGKVAILNSKEASFLFLVQPIFNRQVIIPAIKINSPYLFVERRQDGSINIAEAFFGKPAPVLKNGFRVAVYRISVRDARISIHDNALSVPFSKEVVGLNLDLSFKLPEKVSFDTECKIPSGVPMTIFASGEYDISAKELIAELKLIDIDPEQFSNYYQASGVSSLGGTVDAIAGIHYKENVFEAYITANAQDLSVSKGMMSARLNSEIKTNIRYSISDKELKYSGNIKANDSSLSGVRYINTVENIKGNIAFSEKGFSSELLSGTVSGESVRWTMGVPDYANPRFEISASSGMKLTSFQRILTDGFGIALPVVIDGMGTLSASAIYDITTGRISKLEGDLELENTTIGAGDIAEFIDGVNGKLHFTSNYLAWKNLRFKYRQYAYTSSGGLVNFASPGVHLNLISDDLEADSVFAVNGKTVIFSKLKGRYINSAFTVTGSADFSDPSAVFSDMDGVFELEFNDLKKLSSSMKDKFERAKLSGKARIDLSLAGNIKDLKTCSIDAKIYSSSMSVSGVRPVSTLIEYSQSAGIGDIRRFHSFLYGGTMDATCRIHLDQPQGPYSASVDLHGIRIEKLKVDTPYKDADISGAIHLKTRLTGYRDDPSRLTGTGKLSVVDGKLWQINLLKGLGALIFTSDFSNIVFKEGYCDFFVKDKAVYTDNLKLTSDLIDMQGALRIGFDNTVDAAFKTEMKGSAMEYSSRKDLAETVQKYSTIEIKGTLKEPRFRIKPNVVDFLLDFKDRYFGSEA